MNITKIKKWFENFWYLYKPHIILTACVVFVLALGIYSCVTVEKYDINVMAASSSGMTTSNLERIKLAVAKYTDDGNGGNLKVGVKYKTKSNLNENSEIDYQNSIMVELTIDDAFIFILDKEALDDLIYKGAIDDLSVIFPEIIKESCYGILIEELPITEHLRAFPAERFYMAFRFYSEEDAKKQSYHARYEQSKIIMERILAGKEF